MTEPSMTTRETSAVGRDEEKPSRAPRAFLESLTGSSKGQTIWLADDKFSALVNSDGALELAGGTSEAEHDDVVATLDWEEDGYSVHARKDRQIWVNGHQIKSVKLMHGDMIEFEKSGPMSRYRLCDKSYPKTWTIDDILSDAIAYARSSRRPVPDRLAVAIKESARRVTRQSTIFFRVSMIFALGVIAVLVMVLYQNDRKLEHYLDQDARRIDAVTRLLSQTRQEMPFLKGRPHRAIVQAYGRSVARNRRLWLM